MNTIKYAPMLVMKKEGIPWLEKCMLERVEPQSEAISSPACHSLEPLHKLTQRQNINSKDIFSSAVHTEPEVRDRSTL
jgi:hypothetical protein